MSIITAEMSDNFHAYGLKGHRHTPEIEQQLKILAGTDDLKLTFVPHLLPTIRGDSFDDLYSLEGRVDTRLTFTKLYEDRFARRVFCGCDAGRIHT